MHAPSRHQPLLQHVRPRAHEQPLLHNFGLCWGVVQRQTCSWMTGESGHAPLDPSQEQKPATVNQAVNLQLVGCSKVNIPLHVWLIMVAPWGWAPGSSSCRVKPIHSWPPSDTFVCLTHRQPQRVRATVRNTLSDPGSSSHRHLAPACPTSAPHFILETPSRARRVGLV